ncbi:MAG: T9SS type B sorting domain-containing protein, partial [Flavobacteriales bacterium]|nr:T9SS type B sorting domain-containing protein [Flavobacteriales bacterium]
SDGSIDITITGGTVAGAYDISWTGPVPFTSTLEDISPLAIGTYIVTVTDDNGCTEMLSIDIEDPLPVTVMETIMDVSCSGLSDGSIDIDVTGGASPYGFLWTGPALFTSTDEDIDDLEVGTYDLVITDDNDCIFMFSYEVGQLDGYILEFVVTDVACFGDSTGAIDMIITGGVAPFNINWTGPGTFSSTDEDIADLIAGSYSVTVEDTDMCIKMTDVEVMQNDTIIIDLGITPPTCAGDMDGEIDATVTGGVEPYVFSWTGPSFTAMTEDIDMLLAGTYFLLLTDSVGCTQLVSEDLIDPLEIEIDGMVQDLLCFQDSSGAIDVTIINAIAPYGVSWTGPSSYTSMDEDIMDLIPGTYTITVIDGNGCSQMETFEVVQPDEIVVSETILDVSCFGPLAGAIFLDVSGGTEPYDFSWVGPGAYTSMNEDILGIPTGTYDLTITDDNGCIFEATYFVDETPPITLDAIVGDISCNGEGDGFIDLTVAGGTMPYMINWTGPGTYSSMVEDIDMLEAGTYSVEVEDVDGCVETMSYDILEPDTLDLSVDIMDPSCPFNDGTLEAFPSGGTQPYSIEWSFFMGAFISNDSLIEDLAPGNYTVTITDANDCFVGDTIAINHPDPTVVETVTPVTCPDGMDGAIDLEVMTDDPPAIFSWTGPNMYTSALEDISGLEPGTYTVDVVDQALCAVSLIIEVPFLPPIEIDAVLSQIACAGNDDGAIDLTISNAAAPYVVSWTGPPPFTSSMEDISGLEPGFYDLLITDASGCSSDSTFEIIEGAGLELEFDIQDISCINLEDGAIDITIVNGTAPFNIAWFGPNLFNSDQEDISDLEPGEYTLNIIDANICFTDTILEVLEPDSILLGISTTPSLCSYSDEGSITLDSLGGAMPYDITWTGPNAFGSVMQDIADLFPGSYELLVMDANGCLEDTTLFISAPDTLMVSFQIDDPSCLLDNGQVVAMVTGGTAAIDHSYEWFDDMGMMIGTNDTLENVGSGVYELVILDDNLCTDTISVSISDENYTVDEIVTNISCNAEDDGSIELTITGAQLPITINWMGPDGFISIDEDIFDLEPGVYELTVIDDLGCSYFNTYEVTEPDPIDIVAILSNPPCFGADNGSIELDVTGGTNDFIYSWVGPVPFTSGQEDIFDLEGGTYDLNITDTDGCSTNASYDLDIPLEIVDTATTLMGPICNGFNSGFIDLEIDGGSEPYTFSWVGPSFASTTEDIINLEAGAYTVTVTDSLGCALDFSYDLDNITEIVATSDVSNVTCFGFEDGIIDFFPAGGTSPYDFDWVGPGIFTSSDQNLTDLIPGTYTVTVIDDDNCQNSFDIEVTTPDTIEVFFNVFDPICSYLENGAIDITITGGTTPYDIDWQGPNAFTSDLEDISLLGSGLYSVTITDSLMCTWQGDTTLFSPDDIQVELDSITSPFCSTSPDGAIYITGSGGTGVLSYEWTGPLSYSSLDEDALNVTAGTFDIQITDDNSCALDTFFITTPQIFVVADAGVFGELCDGDTILLDGTNSIAVENYEWVVDGVVVSTDPTFELTLDLSTSMVILNAEGSTCTDSDTLDLSVNELPFVDAGPDLIGFIEDIIAIGGDPTTDPDNIVSWSPSLNLDDTTLFNPNATVQTDQWYIVLVTSPFGCVSQDSMFIDLQAPVDIPNTITPNDDGYNDSWVLDGSLNFPNMEVEIYNRWGEKLFRSVGYSQPWDGTYEGNNVPIGTYYYIIRLNDPMFPGHLDGPISIMR